MEQQVVLLHVVIPLDVPWVVQDTALGRSVHIQTGSLDAHLCLPSVTEADGRIGGVAPTGFEPATHIVDGWASMNWKDKIATQVEVYCAAFKIAIDTYPSENISNISEGMIQSSEGVLEQIHEWLERFNRWMYLLLGQMVDTAYPTPQLLNPRRTRRFVWATVDGTRTRIDSSVGTITIDQTDKHSVLAERVVDEHNLEELVRRASDSNQEAPLFLEMYASARRAALRGQRRLAIAELGTAAESILLRLLGLRPSRNLTLGRLIKQATERDMHLPADFRDAVQSARDKAVHEGVEPEYRSMLRAFELVLQLICRIDPILISSTSSAPAHRPQRLDMTVVKHDG